MENNDSTRGDGKTPVVYDLSWVLREGFGAYKGTHIACQMCEGKGQIILPNWTSPQPCFVCSGVGQVNPKFVPSPEEIQQKLARM